MFRWRLTLTKHRWAAILAVIAGLFMAAERTAEAATAMLAYSKSGAGSPRVRTWNGSAWGAETSANTVGSVPQWLVLSGSPATNQFALATLDDTNDVEVQLWNGAAWSSVFQATADAGAKDTRVFDMAYEQVSGQPLLVYRELGTTDVRYRTHDGTSWSAAFSYTMSAVDSKWLKLIPKSGTDEIMIVASSKDRSAAAMWNGSSFTNLIDLSPTSKSGDKEHLSGALEGTSGQGLTLFDTDDNTPGYRTLTGTVWSAEQNAPDVNGKCKWSRLAADPSSDEVIACEAHTSSKTQAIGLNVWNGSAWGTVMGIETDAHDSRCFDVVYKKGGNDALLVFADNTNTLRYRTWDGFGWTITMPGPNGGTDPFWTIQAVPGISNEQIFVTWGTENKEIRSAVWDGSSFGAATVIGTHSAPKEREVFMTAIAGGQAAPRITSWNELPP